MTLITWQNGGPVLRDGKVGTEAACCCGGGGGNSGGVCVCMGGDICEEGLTEAQCLARLYSICYFEIFEAQLGFVPQAQEDCPPGWNFDGVNGCNKGVCVNSCEECAALNPYGNGVSSCDEGLPIGVWIPNTTCANEFP